MNWLTDLRYGVASVTASSSGGLLKWRQPPSGGAYLSSEIGIYGSIMPESPDAAVAASLYVVSEQPVTVVGVQFRMRAASDAALDAIENVLANCWTDRWGGSLGSVKLVQSRWASGAPLGQDQNGRLERSINFYLTVERQLLHRNI